MKLDQSKAPFLEAVEKYVEKSPVPFDVPGHHMGNIENDATKVFGKDAYLKDINAPIGLDNLANPNGVIKEAEELMAKACGADSCFFLINGTSSGIIAMMMAAVKAGEKILLPRNVHKSVINALILSGAIPVFIAPEIDKELQIANQPSLESWEKAMKRHPNAKAIFVINPTYFGSVSDLQTLVEMAHAHNMVVLVDEAHGAHYYFGANTPKSAMACGADCSAVSTHKTGGSLTQSSVLLLKGDRLDPHHVLKCLNMINTTSPSPLLIGSIDGARKFMVAKGKEAQEKAFSLAVLARKKINKIPGFYAPGKEYFLSHGSFDFDESKVVIGLKGLSIDGPTLYRKIYEEYGIQFELSEKNVVLCIFALGTKKEHVDRLIAALTDISKRFYSPKKVVSLVPEDEKNPFMLLRPRVAFQAPGMICPLDKCRGKISREMVMIYPPGIPLICPGEIWTGSLVRKVGQYMNSGARLLSSYENGFDVIDTDKWTRFPLYRKHLNDYLEANLTTPFSDGFSMPFEGNKHKATVVLLPYRRDTWREKAIPALENYKQVIQAISEHEKVIVGVLPRLYPAYAPMFEGMDNVELIKIRYNDSWARDNMCIFLSNGKSLRSVDFRFNAWGGHYDGLYGNWKDDDRLGGTFSRRYHIRDYRLNQFILEGGSIAVDGEGTLIATEACLLSPGRNPGVSKEEIEDTLKEYLGISKVIWVPHGIYLDETNEHIDNMVAFVAPGEVVMAWCQDENDPQYEYCQQTYAALSASKDAKGRKLRIHKLLLPKTPLFMTSEEAKGIYRGNKEAKERLDGMRLSASYVNFYQGEDFVILPAFGVKEDKLAYQEIQKLFPNKKIHQINTREILLGGGNIHCITQQIPEVD